MMLHVIQSTFRLFSITHSNFPQKYRKIPVITMLITYAVRYTALILLITNLFSGKKPVLDAQLAMPCGHTFCGFCVEQFKKNTGAISCEICRQPGVNFCRNIFTSNVLSSYKAKCTRCSETFDLNMAKQHVRRCQEIEVACDLCQATIKQGDKVAHLQVCPLSDITCECGEKMKKKDEASHKGDNMRHDTGSLPI